MKVGLNESPFGLEIVKRSIWLRGSYIFAMHLDHIFSKISYDFWTNFGKYDHSGCLGFNKNIVKM